MISDPQSLSGKKPILTTCFSGLADPAIQALILSAIPLLI